MIGLGCMRLSTLPDRDDDRAVAVIRAALDAGATLLDTSDAYCHDERDVGHNERLIARALDGWSGDRGRITVATKGGMRRPKGAWLPDGRAKHLRDACVASARALGVEVIDLYQLHVVDPKTPLETSARALARLQADGAVRHVGLCNVTVGQIRVAQEIVPIASVQVSLSAFDDESLRNGVAEYCRDNGIRLIAHRPLGGDRVKRLARDPAIESIARERGVSAEEVALAWLMSYPNVVPIPGATRIETAHSIGRALNIALTPEETQALDAGFSGRLLRVPRAARRPSSPSGDVVMVMGMPGAGKSAIAAELEREGYVRLNRDAAGGSLSQLARRLGEVLSDGNRRVVLDNTYPTRSSRNEVVETAWEHGAGVRCIWVTTDVAHAQVNAIHRMIEAHGSLPTPEIIRERSKTDTRYLLPDAQFRYERTLEPPSLDEGLATIDERPYVRPDSGSARAAILDLDDLLGGAALRTEDVVVTDDLRDALVRLHKDGWLVFIHAWRPQVARGETTLADVSSCLAWAAEQIGFDVDVACCPHDAGPPACWCRKPIPGSVIEFAHRRGVALSRSVIVGTSPADRTMAERLGTRMAPTLADVRPG